VPTKRVTPTVRLRRLAAELRRLRTTAELSREDVSERTGINNATLYRIETARTRPQHRTLLALLQLYDVDDQQRQHLITLAKESAKQGWLQPYHDELPEEYTAYISFEAEAENVRNYESLFIPGLLQTERYARAVIRGVLPTASQQQVEDLVHVRIERQRVLTKDNPLKLWAIVDEAALRRLVGGVETMREQLQHLLQIAAEPNVTVQVIAYSAGAHPGMPGSFVLMGFPDPLDTDLVYIDSMAGDLFLESAADISRYSAIFDHLRAIALSPDASTGLIAELAKIT